MSFGNADWEAFRLYCLSKVQTWKVSPLFEYKLNAEWGRIFATKNSTEPEKNQ